MSSNIDTRSCLNLKAPLTAQSLNSDQRKTIGLQTLAGSTPISHVAEHYAVSRKFVYQQKAKASHALKQAFEEKAQEDKDFIFHLPVTKEWIHQYVLAQILIGHTSYDGVVEILRDLFDFPISKGTIHNIVYSALEQSKAINQQQNLSNIKVGLHDEIYQANRPVLVGCDAHSTYCYLLRTVESCDATAWGVHLIDLAEKQNLQPDYTVADGGQAARRGQQDAWPDIPCHGDVFHALRPFQELVEYLNNSAIHSLEIVSALEHKILHPWGKWKTDAKRRNLIRQVSQAEERSRQALSLADDINTLYSWLKQDILSLIGPSYECRQELISFVNEQLVLREEQCQHRIAPVRKYLENHRESLLKFASMMEKNIGTITREFQVSFEDVWGVYQLKGVSSQHKWAQYTSLREQLGNKFYPIEAAIDDLLSTTVRASSLVENLNSRLRSYFFLRKQLGNDYLDILLFFLNHRQFPNSEREDRRGHSPAELLVGSKHDHWLEMLGFTLFTRAA